MDPSWTFSSFCWCQVRGAIWKKELNNFPDLFRYHCPSPPFVHTFPRALGISGHRQDALTVRRWWLVPPRLSERQQRAKQRLSAVSQSPQDVIDEAQDGEKCGGEGTGYRSYRTGFQKNMVVGSCEKYVAWRNSWLVSQPFLRNTMIVGKRGWSCRSHEIPWHSRQCCCSQRTCF